MPPIGKITAKQVGKDLILTDESGQTFEIETTAQARVFSTTSTLVSI